MPGRLQPLSEGRFLRRRGVPHETCGATGIEHSITGVDGATACATFGTESGRNAPYMRVCVKSIGAAAATGESATVYVVAS